MKPQLLPRWVVEVFYGGDCPLCNREIQLLKWMDRRQRIRFTDIASPEFLPQDYGKTMDDFMREIQGRLADGRWIHGVEVFRQLYAAVGLGPAVWVTRLPLLSQALDAGYRLFAKHRLRLTGRCTPQSCEAR